MGNSGKKEILKENDSLELIKDKIADYLVETFKTRDSNEKKQEIINMVSNISYKERNQIINHISNLGRNIREYENCDDQKQLEFLLKEFDLSDDSIRRTLKLDICELGAGIMNNTGPLGNQNNFSYEKQESYESLNSYNIGNKIKITGVIIRTPAMGGHNPYKNVQNIEISQIGAFSYEVKLDKLKVICILRGNNATFEYQGGGWNKKISTINIHNNGEVDLGDVKMSISPIKYNRHPIRNNHIR